MKQHGNEKGGVAGATLEVGEGKEFAQNRANASTSNVTSIGPMKVEWLLFPKEASGANAIIVNHLKPNEY